MVDFTNIPNNAVAKGGLPSGETMTAIRDNILSVPEGGRNGAPKVAAQALNGLFVGGFQTFNSWSGINDLGEVKKLLLLINEQGGADWHLRFSSDNGASWSSQTTFSGAPANTTTFLVVDVETGALSRVYSGKATYNGGSANLPASGNVNAFQIMSLASNYSISCMAFIIEGASA